MRVEEFLRVLNVDFFTGIPDSQLKALCDYLLERYGTEGVHHRIGVNEGNCVAMAAGYYLSTGKVPVVYLQNSGIGNIINPVASLLNQKVYGIPCIFLVGWRGEPGTADAPQHVFQGMVSKSLLEDAGIETVVLDAAMNCRDVVRIMEHFQKVLAHGGQAAFLVRQKALIHESVRYANCYKMCREAIIGKLVKAAQGDVVVSTTGKASRELFDIREGHGEGHAADFLTVGSMGHASSIAFGVALQHPERKVWCIDGDGAVLMHMGVMALIGTAHLDNFIHIVINNGAHESVGGQPTVANHMDLCGVARACGYLYSFCVEDAEALDDVLRNIRMQSGTIFLEIKAAIGAREDLGRPTITPAENKRAFMDFLSIEEEMWGYGAGR